MVDFKPLILALALAATPGCATPRSEGIGLLIGSTVIIEAVILGNALETAENQRNMGLLHALVIAPAFLITNLSGREKWSPGEKRGIWVAFSLLETLAAYNLIRPASGEPDESEILSANFIVPHCALGALAYYLMREEPDPGRISLSMSPADGGFASAIRFRF